MNITIDNFVLENLFNHFPGEEDYDEFWWAPVLGGEGYIMLWANGEHLHTYHNPENMIESYYLSHGLTPPLLGDTV